VQSRERTLQRPPAANLLSPPTFIDAVALHRATPTCRSPGAIARVERSATRLAGRHMCTRYELHSSPAGVAATFGLEGLPDIQPRYNIAPSHSVPIMRVMARGRRRLVHAIWGLVPFWATDPAIGSRMFNAPAEIISTSRGFRDAYRKGRCLIPASGFYEWARTSAGVRQPFRFALRDETVFGIAGVWTRWRGRDETLLTCAIVTTKANELVQRIHDRMPVILAPDDYAQWLDGSESQRARLMAPYASAEMHGYPVSTRVNRTAVDDPSLIEPRTLVSVAGTLSLV